MTELFRTWLLGVCGAAAFCALAQEATPECRVKNVQKALCGLVMIIALVAPMLKFDFGSYALNLEKYREAGEAVSAKAGEISDSLSRTFIEERCAAYILDKAQLRGAQVTGARVTVRWSGEGVWYPVGADICGKYDSGLSGDIEAELGIAAEDQHWSEDENF